MIDNSESAQDSAIEAPVIIQGIIDNGQMQDVEFSFYAGQAGVRYRGCDQVEFAYFRAQPLSRWRQPAGDGTVGGSLYRVVHGKISPLTPMMTVIIAEKI